MSVQFTPRVIYGQDCVGVFYDPCFGHALATCCNMDRPLRALGVAAATTRPPICAAPCPIGYNTACGLDHGDGGRMS